MLTRMLCRGVATTCARGVVAAAAALALLATLLLILLRTAPLHLGTPQPHQVPPAPPQLPPEPPEPSISREPPELPAARAHFAPQLLPETPAAPEPPAPVPQLLRIPSTLLELSAPGFRHTPGPNDPATDKDVEEVGPACVREQYTAGHARAHSELCAARGAHVRLLVLVASALAHERQRMAVRLTWGTAASRADVALGFVLGSPAPDLRPALDAEDALYGDLIEGNFYDSYNNLTLKSLSTLEWFVTYCPEATRLLKADDDMFINIAGLLQFLDELEKRQATHTIWGNVRPAARPVRNVTSKYFVPREEFPGEQYPRYVGGSAYVITGDAVGPLLEAALSARWLHMEDVLVTGVAAERARVSREDSPAVLLRRKVTDACALRRAFAVHQVVFHEQFELWRDLHNPPDGCLT